MVKICREYGVYSLVDGAHLIGQIPIDVGSADPDFLISVSTIRTDCGRVVNDMLELSQMVIRQTSLRTPIRSKAVCMTSFICGFV